MSSLMDKSKLPGLEARSKMFLRSNSFQKLCSLAHPMRLKGFKSNKEALKSVFESLIVTTRGVLQSVTYRILCFLFLTPFSKLVSEPLASVSQDGRFKTVRFFDCREDFNETASVKPSTEELLNRLLDTSQDATSTSSQLSLRLTVYTCILGCFLQLSALAYLLNEATSIPPGLVFLISSLVYIGYVMMRISFNQCSSMERGKTEPMHTKGSKASTTTTSTAVALVKPPHKKPTTATKGIHPILDAVSKQVASLLQSKKMMMVIPTGSGRLSRCDMAPRSRSRPSVLSADDKTISKIKLF